MLQDVVSECFFRLHILFHSIISRCLESTDEALLHVPHSCLSQKVPEDEVFHNKEDQIRFQIFWCVPEKQRQGSMFAHMCKTSRYTENQQKLLWVTKNIRVYQTLWGSCAQGPHNMPVAFLIIIYYQCVQFCHRRWQNLLLTPRAVMQSLQWACSKNTTLTCHGYRLVRVVMQSSSSLAITPQETSDVFWSPAEHPHDVN